MRIGVIGVNHKLADLKLREKLAKSCQRWFGTGSSLQPFVLLSTCNRTEVYFSTEDLAETHGYILHILKEDLAIDQDTFDQKLYSYFSQDCFNHLARVVAGLDSAIVAETEIQGQVKTAYEAASSHFKLNSDLHFLFQKTLKIGKQVRSRLSLGRGMPSLEHALLQAGYHFFPDLEKTSVLFVGVSDINCKMLSFLHKKQVGNVAICNRTEKKAEELAHKYQIDSIQWESLGRWHAYDWIICGTKSPEHLIRKQDIPQDLKNPRLIVDLSVPRNVEPQVGRDNRVTLLNIDQINRMLKFRKKQLHTRLREAEELVSRSCKRQAHCFKKKQSFIKLAALHSA